MLTTSEFIRNREPITRPKLVKIAPPKRGNTLRPPPTVDRGFIQPNVPAQTNQRRNEVRAQIPMLFGPEPDPQSSNDGNLVAALTNVLQASMNKPNLDLFKFNSDATTYTRFINALEATIEKIEPDNRMRLLYLIQHCEGKAKSLIQYCVLLDPNVGYFKAKQILYENYGRKPLIACAYIKNLVDGRSIRQDVSRALIRFAHDVEECNTTLMHMQYFADINCFENISKIAKRLPSGLQNRWLRAVASIERRNREPTFSDLMEFVKEEAQVVSSCYAFASIWKLSKTSAVPKFNAHSTIVSKPSTSSHELCPYCSKGYNLWDCSSFARKGLNARLQFMRQKRLCDNCAKRGHVSKFCFSKSKCTHANYRFKHHTLLHRDLPSHVATKEASNFKRLTKSVGTSTESSNDNSTVSGLTATVFVSDSAYLNVITVRVSCGNKSVITYAFLHQGSTATFSEKRLLEELDATGEDIAFKIATINGNLTSRQGVKVSLTITSLMGPEYLVLHDVLSIDSLPIQPNPSLTRKNLGSWPYLKDLDMPQVEGGVSILISVNVPEAFWVLKERRSDITDPYAVRTKLGWSLIGPKYPGDSSSTNAISVNFVNTVHENILDKQIECLWAVDNVPAINRSVCLSKEDRYALQIMKSSKKFDDGHFEVAFPWRPGCPKLQDNQDQATSRLASLKRRFDKDSNLKDKYVNVVESYMSNGHAELSKSNEINCSGWYLPHHPVLHPRKR